MKSLKLLGVLGLILGLGACEGNQSLQQYYVDNQENKDFIALDVPTSMFANSESLDEEQRRTLETIKKINLLAISKKVANLEKIETEKNNIREILKDEKYQLLMKYGGGDSGVEVFFTGDEEAIEELIIYGFDDARGMGIARVLGDDMNPSDIMSLMKSLEEGDINMGGLSEIREIFSDEAVTE